MPVFPLLFHTSRFSCSLVCSLSLTHTHTHCSLLSLGHTTSLLLSLSLSLSLSRARFILRSLPPHSWLSLTPLLSLSYWKALRARKRLEPTVTHTTRLMANPHISFSVGVNAQPISKPAQNSVCVLSLFKCCCCWLYFIDLFSHTPQVCSLSILVWHTALLHGFPAAATAHTALT